MATIQEQMDNAESSHLSSRYLQGTIFNRIGAIDRVIREQVHSLRLCDGVGGEEKKGVEALYQRIAPHPLLHL
jgi:hypothetical protein